MNRRKALAMLCGLPVLGAVSTPHTHERITVEIDGKKIADLLLEKMPYRRTHKLEVTEPWDANKRYQLLRTGSEGTIEEKVRLYEERKRRGIIHG